MIVFLLLMQSFAYAQSPSDYLILQTIGQYHSSGKGRCGAGSGILGGTDHFDEDHNVTTCSTGYYFMAQDLAVSIKVEQHAGGDSDRWLLHEIETGFRDSDNLESGPDEDTRIRTIDNNKIFFYSSGVVGYRWINNNIVVDIEYTNLTGPKAEPLEVVNAYLAKFPSTLIITDAELKASAHSVQWIKDEMERRLWLCDKWNAQYQAGSVTQANLISSLLSNMGKFLKYREKYFNIAALDDDTLLTTYHKNNDLMSIQNKLKEYKTWWAKHKDKHISLR